jgi:serine/threonine-protein kinase RsbT
MGMSQMKEVEMRTAVTELMTNMLRYAGGGLAIVEEVEHESIRGLRAKFQDKGPGIADLNAAVKPGFSTGKSLGHGLSGCKNLVDAFDLSSVPGQGTRVVITKWC